MTQDRGREGTWGRREGTRSFPSASRAMSQHKHCWDQPIVGIPSSHRPVHPSNPHAEPPLGLPFLPSSSKEPGNGPLSHWAHIISGNGSLLHSIPKGSLPRPLTSSQLVSTHPSLRARQFLPAPQHPSFRLGPTLAPPPCLTSPLWINWVPVFSPSPLTLPNS